MVAGPEETATVIVGHPIPVPTPTPSPIPMPTPAAVHCHFMQSRVATTRDPPEFLANVV